MNFKSAEFNRVFLTPRESKTVAKFRYREAERVARICACVSGYLALHDPSPPPPPQHDPWPERREDEYESDPARICVVNASAWVHYAISSQVHSPWVGDIVDSLSYRPTTLCSLADQYDNPVPESALSPQSGTMNLATDFPGIPSDLPSVYVVDT